MMNKKEAAPGAGTPKSGRENGCWQAPDNPQDYLSTTPERGQGFIEKLLSRGAENAVPLRQLVEWTGLDGRTLRKMIESERRAGCPVLSDNRSGYYLASGPDEARAFVQSMLHRSGEIAKTAKAIERAMLNQIDGQMQILE